MASIVHVHRDMDIYKALDRCPLTVRQLLKLSQTFEQPFTSERYLQKRLQALALSGRVRQARLGGVTAGRSTPDLPNYYKLAPEGYRLLHGPQALPPTRRYFAPVGIAYQEHTRALADFIVHTAVCAFRAGITLSGFCRENTVRLSSADGEVLLPDSAFQLVRDGREFSFFLELDNHGQRLTSESEEAESWTKKLRLYETLQDRSEKRFRLLVVTTRQSDRLQHILELAARVARNPERSLCYGVSLPAYLARTDAVTGACFRDHRGRAVALVHEATRHSSRVRARIPAELLVAAPAVC